MTKVSNSLSNAGNENQERFASVGLIIGLIVAVAAALFWLAPDKSLERLLNRSEDPTPTSLKYLRLLAKEHPNSLEYQRQLAEQLIAMGNYQEAVQILEKFVRHYPETLAAYLNALEHQYFALSESDPARQALKNKLMDLIQSEKDPRHLEKLAETTKHLGDAQLTMHLYRQILMTSSDAALKRQVFEEAIKIQLAQGDSQKALALALNLLPMIQPSQRTYRFLSKLALMSANAECASYFARLLVGISQPQGENQCISTGH